MNSMSHALSALKHFGIISHINVRLSNCLANRPVMMGCITLKI